MPGPVARLRLLAGVAALATIAAGSVAFASGTSATAGSSAAAVTAPFVGPVAAPPAPQPLIRTDGPLLPLLAPRPARLTAAARVMGPAVGAAPAPVLDEVGPESGVAAVRRVQRLLNSRGAGLRIDGAWGPATTAAVRRLQARLGLPVDGRAGPETLRALRD